MLPAVFHAAMPYTSAQCIAYALNTAPWSNTVFRNYHNGDPVFDQQKFYLGSKVPTQDIKARVKIMAEAITTAQASGHCGSGDTLKIFMAPEFFFRGFLGAYHMDDAQTVIEALREVLKAGPYEHWLFVFGTTLGFSRSTGSTKEVYNFTVVQKGSGTISDSRAVMKEFKSGIDFVGDKIVYTGSQWIVAAATVGLTDSFVEHLSPVSGPGAGKERQSYDFDGNSIFELDGITFGLEVCLDHAEQRLRKSPNKVGQNQIQIQLVPSAGMEICANAVVAMKGGLVFNCDGSYGLPGKSPADAHSSLHKVTKMHVGANDAETTSLDPDHVLPVTAVGGFDTYFAKGPGEVHIYPAQPIPAAQKETLENR